MSDERQIDLLTRAAHQGRPRGADVVWHEASAAAGTARLVPARPAFRAGFALAAAAAVVVAVVLLQRPEVTAVRSAQAGHATVLVPLEGWIVGARHPATAPTPDLAGYPRLHVYRRGDGVLVRSELARGRDGITWTVPEGSDLTKVTVAGMPARLTESGNLNNLAVMTVTAPDGRRSRVLAHGITRRELLDRAAELVRGATPTGFRPVYDGGDSGGVASVPLPARSRTVVTLPGGARVTIESASVPFDADAVSWLSPGSVRRTVHGRRALLLDLRDERSLAWAEDGTSILLTSADATAQELDAVARTIVIRPGR